MTELIRISEDFFVVTDDQKKICIGDFYFDNDSSRVLQRFSSTIVSNLRNCNKVIKSTQPLIQPEFPNATLQAKIDVMYMDLSLTRMLVRGLKGQRWYIDMDEKSTRVLELKENTKDTIKFIETFHKLTEFIYDSEEYGVNTEMGLNKALANLLMAHRTDITRVIDAENGMIYHLWEILEQRRVLNSYYEDEVLKNFLCHSRLFWDIVLDIYNVNRGR